MKKIVKKLINSSIYSILSLFFSKNVRAQNSGVTSEMYPLYGIIRPTPGDILSRLLPYISGVFLISFVAPIIGLIWYQKRGGTKRWPTMAVWILTMFFVIALTALIIYIYSSL